VLNNVLPATITLMIPALLPSAAAALAATSAARLADSGPVWLRASSSTDIRLQW
jgi:hypothetical protein